MLKTYYNDGIGNGTYYEGEFLNAIRNFMKKNGQEQLMISTAGTDRDKNEGTDAVIFGIPVDITANYKGKDNMLSIADSIELVRFGLTIRYGIRLGNSHHGFTKFNEPVLVIGMDGYADIIGKYMDQIIREISARMEEILNTGIDAYYNYIDTEEV